MVFQESEEMIGLVQTHRRRTHTRSST